LRLLRLIGLWAPVLGFMLGVFLLAGQPAPAVVGLAWDKLLHVGAYTVFGFLCLRATHGGIRKPSRPHVLLALLLAVGYAALDEWHQTVVPGRDPSALDWVADSVGAALSFLIYARLGSAIRQETV
jgi:VanZ family protein